MVTMFGCDRRPAECASRLKRTRTSASCAGSNTSVSSILMATRRSITLSKASYTTPIAPRPIWLRISYLPMLAGMLKARPPGDEAITSRRASGAAAASARAPSRPDAARLLQLVGGALRLLLRAGARGPQRGVVQQQRGVDVRREPLLGVIERIDQLVERLERAPEVGVVALDLALQVRSEEHTSELQ